MFKHADASEILDRIDTLIEDERLRLTPGPYPFITIGHRCPVITHPLPRRKGAG